MLEKPWQKKDIGKQFEKMKPEKQKKINHTHTKKKEKDKSQ